MRLKKSYTTFIMEFKSYISSVLDLDGLSSDEVASLLQDVADPRMGDVLKQGGDFVGTQSVKVEHG